MAEQIPYHLDEVGPGWHPLLRRLHERLLAVDPDYAVTQVKEKYGMLRVYPVTGMLREPYISTGRPPKEQEAAEIARRDERLRHLIGEAERESGRTCEACGRPGRTRKGLWIKTLCDDCHRPRAAT